MKREYKEARELDEKLYDKSILSHDDDETDSMKNYEFSIMHHDDDYANNNDYEWHIGHFSDD